MAIPQFKHFILPFLENLSDGKEHSMKDAENALAERFKVTSEELERTTPSGRMTIFSNRVGWAKTYLKKAGLVEAPRGGLFKITAEGQKVLSQKPEIIDPKFLDQFSSFREFNYGETETKDPQEENGVSEHTPEETMEEGYQNIAKELQAELLDRLKNSSPGFFEQAVIDLLLSMGYGGSRKDAGKAIGKSGDEGIDGVISEDRLGLDSIYIQAKRWSTTTVGRPEIQSFVGAISVKHAKKGIFITTAGFSKEAREYAEKPETKIVLIDGLQLVKLMIEHNVGVSVIATYEIKKVDSDYFVEE